MGTSMSRRCHEAKTSEVWPEHTRTRAVNHPDFATSPGTLPQAWASTSHPWKVTLLVVITASPRFEIRCLTSRKLKSKRSYLAVPPVSVLQERKDASLWACWQEVLLKRQRCVMEIVWCGWTEPQCPTSHTPHSTGWYIVNPFFVW